MQAFLSSMTIQHSNKTLPIAASSAATTTTRTTNSTTMKFAPSVVFDAVTAQASSKNLSSNAHSSLKDFERQLAYLGKDILDEDAFNALLDNIGYKRSREGLFESLLQEVAASVNASSSLITNGEYDGVGEHQEVSNNKFDEKKVEDDGAPKSKRFITVTDIAKMYESDAYHLLDNGKDSGDSLMEYVRELYIKFDADGNGIMSKEEFRDFFRAVMGKDINDDVADDAFTSLVGESGSSITLQEFQEGILKSNKNKNSGLPGAFNYNLVSPTLTSANEFVSALENYTKNHPAVTHHLLENVACASFGGKDTADVILLFLSAYAKFNCGFVSRLQKLIYSLSNPKERDVLRENLREEMGFYEEETLEECEMMGIPRESIENVPHHDLFLDLVKTVENKVKCSYFDYIPEHLNEEMSKVQDELTSKGKIGLLSSLYFGSELIVPYIYSSLLVGLQLSLDLTPAESRFLLLHVNMDCDHADSMREIIVSHCKTAEDRIEFVKCTEKVLNARVSFYDKLGALNNRQSVYLKASKLYDNQATKWSREKPRILSDFTGRPIVYDYISEHVEGASVLDVGCGEGFVSRNMTKMGAAKVVGIDVSPGMINRAISHPDKDENEYFLTGDASSGLRQSLIDNASDCNMMLGANFDTGAFELSVAVFLFNYMSISSMNKTFKEVHSLLKPGGHFVFSVPHPFMASHSTAAFGFNSADHDGDGSYFALRDKCLEGHIGTVDGDKLNVRMQFKTIEDYINAATSNGFEIVTFTEARVRAEDMLGDPQFFSAVNGYPLHIVMKVRKPVSTSEAVSLASVNTLDILPKKLNWPRTVTNNVENSLVMWLPKEVNDEIVDASLQVFEKGISVDVLDIGNDITLSSSSRGRKKEAFFATKTFAIQVRNRLLHDTGAVIIKGLDMEALGGVEQLEKMTTCSKIAYFLICEHIGTVDATARGKLFDVKSSTNIDANSKKADNVLFSVSDSEAGWHTDGASKDRVYDVVSLLCISPAAQGGKFRVSNACDVFDELNRALPKFLMYELTRAIPRDILENGAGKGTVGAANALSRSAGLLAMRVKYNSYPIYVVEGDRMRFRYMRHWIETGHEKTFWKVPTFLRIAMDILDDHLDEACCFHQALERGDMIFANNAMLAHARDQFKNDPNAPPRHKVRAWIQVQKAAIANETEVATKDLSSSRQHSKAKNKTLARIKSIANLIMKNV